MYINCALISVSSGNSNTAFFKSLPNIFITNLPNTAYSTIEDFNFAFPKLGDLVVTSS